MRKSLVIDAPAKINLTLDIVGVEGGYHQLNSLVTTIKIKDRITVKKRKDDQITLKVRGGILDCDVHQNNAYKTAVAFQMKSKV